MEDLEALKKLGIDLKLDFILNHASAQSPQFTDLVQQESSQNTKTSLSTGMTFGKGTAL